MTFGERLIELRKEKGYNTRKDFANFLNIPTTTLRNYETNAREPGHTFLKQISDIFNVSIDYLLCITNNKEKLKNNELNESELLHIEKYRVLDDHAKRMIDTIMEMEYDRCSTTTNQLNEEKSSLSLMKIIPLANSSLSAGTGLEPLTDTYETIEVDKMIYPNADIAFKVKGDSMNPVYFDGDVVYVQTQQIIENGQIGAFLYNGEQYLKKFVIKNGNYILRSLNDRYKDIEVKENDDLIVYGRVLN